MQWCAGAVEANGSVAETRQPSKMEKGVGVEGNLLQ